MKVYALKDNVKKFIKHVPTGYKFDANGVSDWPDDQFTRRRLRDGDISLEPPKRGATVTKSEKLDAAPDSIVGRFQRREEQLQATTQQKSKTS